MRVMEATGYDNYRKFMDSVFTVQIEFHISSLEGVLELPASRFLAMVDYLKRRNEEIAAKMNGR